MENKNNISLSLVVSFLVGAVLMYLLYPAMMGMGAEKMAEANKKVVMEFEELAFEKKDPAAAAELLTDDFKQHNPQVPDKKEGFVQGIGYMHSTYPNLKLETKRVVASGDMVVVHKYGKYDWNNPEERGVAVIDIFRLMDGKIAEHWDVIQEIPAQSANPNTMF